MKDPVRLVRTVNRETGQIQEEAVPSGDSLHRLYHSTVGTILTESLLKRRWVSTLYGRLKDRRGSRKEIEAFARSVGIDPDEAEKPLAEYRTLNEFFARRLKPGTRPIDPDPEILISPADCQLLVYPAAEGDAVVPLKGSPWNIGEILADPDLAGRYEGGPVAVLRLAPRNYHRFHFVDAGTPGPTRTIRGPLHSVSPLALSSGKQILARNKRDITPLRSRGFGDLAHVDVGAMMVGKIVQTHEPGLPVARGDEKGYFSFGGSSIVLLFEPGRVRFDDDLVGWSAQGLETCVRFGERIGVRPAIASHPMARKTGEMAP